MYKSENYNFCCYTTVASICVFYIHVHTVQESHNKYTIERIWVRVLLIYSGDDNWTSNECESYGDMKNV